MNYFIFLIIDLIEFHSEFNCFVIICSLLNYLLIDGADKTGAADKTGLFK
jgi:hypothetical protein